MVAGAMGERWLGRAKMKSVTIDSADGTPLVVRVSGSGPALVLVHGTTGSKDSWALVEPLLAERHTVWNYDRRGRGESGDGDDYDYDLEIDDLVAVSTAVGDDVHIVGHSFGARCALDAVPRLTRPVSLVLYEPPVHVVEARSVAEDALQAIEEGRVAEGLSTFSRELAGISEEEMQLRRSAPAVWEAYLATAPTAVREVRSLLRRSWSPPYRSDLPTLYLRGGATEVATYLAEDEIPTALPTAEVVDLPGQRHIAFATDPVRFATIVTDWVHRHSR